MSKEMLLVVQSVANEKGVDAEVIFEAMEIALAQATEKFHNDEMKVRVSIDRKDGSYESFRYWTVVADDEFEDEKTQINLVDAHKNDDGLEEGDRVEEPVASIDFGRVSAQTAKQVIIQKVREAEKAKLVRAFKDEVGKMVSGKVRRVTRELLVVDIGNGAEAILPRSELIPREVFRVNDRIKAVIDSVGQPGKSASQIMLSRRAPSLVAELLKLEVPEVSEQVIEIMAAVRDPGLRAKVAVKTNDRRIDPVGACVGMRGSRIQVISDELNNERIDVVLWDDDPAQLVISAMAPAEISSIIIDDERHSVDIAVAEDQLAQAIGRNGQNVKLASKLTGYTLNVMSNDQADERQAAEQEAIQNMFVEHVKVTPEIAQELTELEITSLDEVAYIEPSALLQLEGVDEAMVETMQANAKDALLSQALTGQEIVPAVPASDLLCLPGLEKEMAYQLAKKSITTREELAELAVDDLLDLVEIDSTQAGELIMKAREHWFEDDNKVQ